MLPINLSSLQQQVLPHPLQPLVLATCPLSHLEGTSSSEQARCQCACADGEQDPAPDLSCVVGTGDVVEQEACGDLVALLPGLAQVGQNDVAPAWERGSHVHGRERERG